MSKRSPCVQNDRSNLEASDGAQVAHMGVQN